MPGRPSPERRDRVGRRAAGPAEARGPLAVAAFAGRAGGRAGGRKLPGSPLPARLARPAARARRFRDPRRVSRAPPLSRSRERESLTPRAGNSRPRGLATCGHAWLLTFGGAGRVGAARANVGDRGRSWRFAQQSGEGLLSRPGEPGPGLGALGPRVSRAAASRPAPPRPGSVRREPRSVTASSG